MSRSLRPSRRAGCVVLVIVFIVSTSVPGVMTVAAKKAPDELVGNLYVTWGDPRAGTPLTDRVAHVLYDDQGEAIDLLIDPEIEARSGGPTALNRRRVKVKGTKIEKEDKEKKQKKTKFKVQWLEVQGLSDTEQPQQSSSTAQAQAAGGSQPWVTVMCRFADAPSVTPRPANWLDAMFANTYPGLDDYWREVTFDTLNIAGSIVVGWYTLPKPRSAYVTDSGLAFAMAADDCSAVADADVYFPAFAGVNFAFNQDLDGYAWGGGSELNRDGVIRGYRTTWLPPWGWENQSVLAHETGHGFGLPHSSGPYDAVYDSSWDVMSNAWVCAPPHATYGCIGQGTISYHKDLLGAIPAEAKVTLATSDRQTLNIDALDAPAAPGNVLMAQIPIAGSDIRFYTVEVRRINGYDDQVPSAAVLLHKVDTSSGARVVDPDNNGDPNDAGAAWLPGETFTDIANGISVSVNAATATGFTVTLQCDTCDRSDPVPPDIVWTAPVGSQQVYTTSGGMVTLDVDATDNVGITEVVFERWDPSLQQFMLIGSDTSAPYQAQLDVSTLNPEWNQVNAYANDAAGNGVSDYIWIDRQAGTPVLSVTKDGTGRGTITSTPSGINCGVICSTTYMTTTTVTLKASAANGSTFTGWSGNCTGTVTTCVVSVDAAKSVTATFADPTRPVRITGKVLNAGQPVPNVTVSSACKPVSGSSCRATTDGKTLADGSFVVHGTPGTYELYVLPATGVSSSQTTLVTATVSGAYPGQILEVQELVAVGGTITDAYSGAGLQGVKLTVTISQQSSSKTVTLATATTVAGGSYTLKLAPGTSKVKLAKSGYRTRTVALIVTGPTTSQHFTLQR